MLECGFDILYKLGTLFFSEHTWVFLILAHRVHQSFYHDAISLQLAQDQRYIRADVLDNNVETLSRRFASFVCHGLACCVHRIAYLVHFIKVAHFLYQQEPLIITGRGAAPVFCIGGLVLGRKHVLFVKRAPDVRLVHVVRHQQKVRNQFQQERKVLVLAAGRRRAPAEIYARETLQHVVNRQVLTCLLVLLFLVLVCSEHDQKHRALEEFVLAVVHVGTHQVVVCGTPVRMLKHIVAYVEHVVAVRGFVLGIKAVEECLEQRLLCISRVEEFLLARFGCLRGYVFALTPAKFFLRLGPVHRLLVQSAQDVV